MANMGMQMMGNSAQGQMIAERASGFFGSLKSYFAVSQHYVLRKILYLLCPFIKVVQSLKQDSQASWGGAPQGESGKGTDGDGLKTDVDSPDLYAFFFSMNSIRY